MSRHNIVGSETGRSHVPGHGSITSVVTRKRGRRLAPLGIVAVALVAASTAALLVRHPL